MKKYIWFVLGILFLLPIFITTDKPVFAEVNRDSERITDENPLGYIPYHEYLSQYEGVNRPNRTISINLFDYEVEGLEVDELEDSLYTGERGFITWTFEVSEEGLYNLEIEFLPVIGRSSSIQREIYIDGEIPFQGAHQITFSRIWVDDGPISVKGRNEIRPNQVEAPEWTTVYVSDSQKYVSEPYLFYLSRGKHTLTFHSIREPLTIRKLEFKQAPEVPTYQEYITELMEKYPIYSGEAIIFQAERIGGKGNHTVNIKKSSPTIYAVSNFSSPLLQPYHPYDIRLNTIGGYNWRVIGDWVRWEVEVPKSGLYQLSLSVLQNTSRGKFSTRELRINGLVPFKEAFAIKFDYNTSFEMVTVGNGKEPYLIYLEEGINTIELQVTLGPLGPIVQEVQESVTILNDLYRQIMQITGPVPEPYIDYELEKKLPHMQPTFEKEYQRLKRIVNDLQTIAGDKSDQTALIDQMAVQLGSLSKKPREVIRQLNMMQSNISAMSTWILQANEQPLEIDFFVLSQPNAKLPRVKANLFERLYFSIFRFISTFFVDYNDFSSEAGDKMETIEVWIQSGRDQVQILRNLIDNSFTPNYNINVNLKLVPQGVVLPATLAGQGPDVVLGLSGDTTINFAMRDAAQDLTVFDDFDEVAQRFMPSAFDTVKYQDGVYGLPETQSFYMLFYRKDIINGLGLQVPKTWNDVYELIPHLEMNNYQFYIPSSLEMYATFVYQMGGRVYRGEGKDLGIASGLDSKEGMEAFKVWTDFFTSYKLPVEANFANRFRTGEMPIGIADYTLYNTLAVFAPEITGLWGFAPVPGFENEDGTINNLSASFIVNCMMLSSAENKKASWEFMKWWTSTDTQVSYGRALEGVMGAAARYNTANLEAVARLPWDSESYDQLSKQFENTFTIPAVPGGYITSRHVDYALRSVVNDGMNAREALYENIKAINLELTIKRQEFGLSYLEERGKSNDR